MNFDINRYKKLAVPVLVVAFIVVSAVLFLYPKANQLIAYQGKLKKDQAYLAQLTAKASLLGSLDKNEIDTKSGRMLQVIPAFKNPVVGFSALKVLASQQQMVNVSVNVNPGLISTESAKVKSGSAKASTKSSSEQKNQVEFEFKATTSPEQLVAFLKQVGKLAPLMRLTAIDIEKNSTEVTFGAGFISFYYSLPIEISKIDSPISTLVANDEAAYNKALTLQPLSSLPNFEPVATGKDNPFQF